MRVLFCIKTKIFLPDLFTRDKEKGLVDYKYEEYYI